MTNNYTLCLDPEDTRFVSKYFHDNNIKDHNGEHMTLNKIWYSVIKCWIDDLRANGMSEVKSDVRRH